MFRSWGDAASRHASRSASGIEESASSSASVVPAPITPLRTPRGTTPRTSTSCSATSNPSRSSGTTSVPPWTKTPPSSSSRLDGRRSSTPALRIRGLERAEHLLPGDRQLVHLCARRIADRVRDRGGDGHDRRLAETLRAEIRQVLVGLVDELAHDLRHVGNRRHAVGVERGREDAARLGIEQPVLGERVADALDDSALDLARRAERVDDPADVVDRRDALDPNLSCLDVDSDLDDVDAEREDAHARRIESARAPAEDLRLLEQADDLGDRDRKSTRLNSSHSQISY